MALRRTVARLIRIAIGVFALGSAAPALRAPLAAQVVRGTVTEKNTNTPLSGVLLSVLDSARATVVQALTDERGEFEVRLPSAGTFSLDAKRIGVRRTTLPAFAIGAGETRRVDITVEPLPAVLSSVRITGRTSCVRNPEKNAQTAALWEDARTALTASVITRDRMASNDSVVRFDRKLDATTWRVLYENRRKVSVSMDRPFRSLPAEVLSVGGYVTVNQDGSTDYYAPDADVLLSDTFLADHCFKIVTPGPYGQGHEGHIGLAFQPIPERNKPDVKGTLWMDAKTSELKTLEFEYTWLPYGLRPVDYGGTVSFFRMPGGHWIIRSWRIRMPEYGFGKSSERYDGTRVAYGRSSTPHLVRISEEGGAVPLDVLLNQAGRVHGRVVLDTVSNKPVAGITVALDGTADSTVTAVDGSFELPFIDPGSYTLVLRHSALDSLGIVHLARTVEVDLGKSEPVSIRFPTNEELALRMCSEPVDFDRQAIIRFLIVDESTGKPMSNAPAIFSRAPIADGKVVADSAASWDVTLDRAGGFLACALRMDEVVRLEGVPDIPIPWGETIRPRSGMIGWHVIRVGKKGNRQ